MESKKIEEINDKIDELGYCAAGIEALKRAMDCQIELVAKAPPPDFYHLNYILSRLLEQQTRNIDALIEFIQNY